MSCVKVSFKLTFVYWQTFKALIIWGSFIAPHFDPLATEPCTTVLLMFTCVAHILILLKVEATRASGTYSVTVLPVHNKAI